MTPPKKSTPKKTKAPAKPTATTSEAFTPVDRPLPKLYKVKDVKAAAKPASVKPPAPKVPIKLYTFIPDRITAFCADHTGATVNNALLPGLSRADGEALLRAPAPAFVNVPQNQGWTAEDLTAFGFDVFINGPKGQLVGTKV